jgi:TPR repeat protein
LEISISKQKFGHGSKVSPSFEPCQTFKYLKTAADQGDICAQRMTGLCYEKGEGIEQSWDQAFKYYHLATNHKELYEPNSLEEQAQRRAYGRGF